MKPLDLIRAFTDRITCTKLEIVRVKQSEHFSDDYYVADISIKSFFDKEPRKLTLYHYNTTWVSSSAWFDDDGNEYGGVYATAIRKTCEINDKAESKKFWAEEAKSIIRHRHV